MDAKHSTHDGVKRREVHEGPQKHLIAFLLSIILTVLSFIAVTYKSELDKPFVPLFILALAILQALVQAIFWMHLKDRGHFHQRLFIASGAMVALTLLITAIFWVWW